VPARFSNTLDPWSPVGRTLREPDRPRAMDRFPGNLLFSCEWTSTRPWPRFLFNLIPSPIGVLSVWRPAHLQSQVSHCCSILLDGQPALPRVESVPGRALTGHGVCFCLPVSGPLLSRALANPSFFCWSSGHPRPR
jgi:hypothetical protein